MTKETPDATRPPKVDLSDVQGLVKSGYSRWPHSAYLFFSVTRGAPPGALRAALARLIPDVRHAAHGNEHLQHLSVALGFGVLGALGLSTDDTSSFPRELRAGMATRARLLADAPDAWSFGRASDPALDVLVIAYAHSVQDLDAATDRVREALTGPLTALHARGTEDRGVLRRDHHEHFGFRDGVSNPFIAGVREPAPHEQVTQGPVHTGEFLLGYHNEYGMLPASPSASRRGVAVEAELEDSVFDARKLDIGKNGTFLVYRKLEQDVRGYRAWLTTASAEVTAPTDDKAAWLSARLVGRWPDGTATVVSEDRPTGDTTNVFEFGPYPDKPDTPATQRDGSKCPFGAHIRRANPRDALYPNREESLAVVARHRILRRGRAYGPVAETPLPDGDTGERGIVFICINANIERQFEFVQQTWLNSTKFDGLYDEVDPIVGVRPGTEASGKADRLTVQTRSAPIRLGNVPRFVRTVGGGYFFLPSLAVLRFLCADSDRTK